MTVPASFDDSFKKMNLEVNMHPWRHTKLYQPPVIDIVTLQPMYSHSLLYCHTLLHLGFLAKLKVWQIPACKMELQPGIILLKPPTLPPAAHLVLTDEMSKHIFLSMLCGVPIPIPPTI